MAGEAPDTVSPDSTYLDKNEQRNVSATMQRILDGMSRDNPAAVEAAPPPPQPGEPGQPTVPDGPRGAYKNSIKPDPDPYKIPLSEAGNLPADQRRAYFSQWGLDVMKSTVHGAQEVPGQLIGGAFEGVRQVGSMLGDMGDWLDKNLPEAVVGSPEYQAEVNKKFREEHGKPLEFSSKNLLGVGGEAETGIGTFARGIGQFMVLYNPLIKAMQAGNVAKALASPLASGLSMFLGNDPTKPNLVGMITEKYPQLHGPITDFLATNGDDPQIVNRLRNMVEGVVGDRFANLIMKGLGAAATWQRVAPKTLPTSPEGVPRIGTGAAQEAAPLTPAQEAEFRNADELVTKAGGVPDASKPKFELKEKAKDLAETAIGNVPTTVAENLPPPGGAAEAGVRGVVAGAAKGAAKEAETATTRVYHGTNAEIQGPLASKPEEFMLDRSLGIHVSKDPAIANTFASKEGGHVIPLDINEQKFLPVEQPKYPVSGATKTDQVAIEQMVMKEAYKSDPEMLERYLTEARKIPPEEAKTAAADLAAGKTVKLSTEGDKEYTLDSFLNNYGGRPYNAADRGKAVQIARESWQQQGYDGLKYENTSPMETAGVKDKSSYVLFDAGKAGKPFAAQQKLAEVGTTAGPDVPGAVTGRAVVEATGKQTAEALKVGSLRDLDLKVNWENIDRGDLTGTIGEIASQLKDRISAAKRGEITLEGQKLLANQLGMSQEDLIARGIGQAYNAEQLTAAGMLLHASDERLYQLAQIASRPLANDADAFAINEAMTMHMALTEQFLGVAGEAGRALGALRQVHQMGLVSRARAMQQYLNDHGGIEGQRRMAQMILDLKADNAPPGAMNEALRHSWGRWSWDAFKEAWAMGFLWRPTTQIRNLLGNTIEAVWQTADIKTAEMYSKILGTPTEHAYLPGEALANMRGQIASLGEAFRTAGKAIKQGDRQFEPYASGGAGGKTETDAAMQTAMVDPRNKLAPHPYASVGEEPSALSARAIARQRRMTAAEEQAFVESPTGKLIDYVVGDPIRLPGRFLNAGDDLFKVIGYRGYIEQQAHRQAMSQGLKGEDYQKAITDFMENVPDRVRLDAVDHAMLATFNNAPGSWGNAILYARNNIQPMFIAMPYVRTPSNIFRTAIERSPLAPVLSQWRADIAGGGRERDLALAKMTTGSTALALLFDFAHNGNMTGPMTGGDKTLMEARQGRGERPLSVRVGKVQVDLTGLGQLAPPIAFAGAVNEMMQNKDLHPEAYDTVDEMISTVASIIAYSTTNQSYLTGLNKLFGALNDAGKDGGKSSMGQYLRGLTGDLSNLVPAVSGLRLVGHTMDPQERQIATFMDAILYKDMPGLSDKLIPVRDVLGHEIKQQPAGVAGTLYNFMVPFRLSWMNDSPFYNELVRLHSGVERIGWTAPFQNADINFRDYPEVLDMYRRLAGNELKQNPQTHEAIGFEDFINRVISGKDPMFSSEYQRLSDPGATGTDSGKAQFIKKWAEIYRQGAQKQIMWEAGPQGLNRYPDFYKAVNEGKAHKETQKLPIPFQGQGIEASQDAIRQNFERPLQSPLPDRFGRPAVVPSRNPPSIGGFTAPSQ